MFRGYKLFLGVLLTVGVTPMLVHAQMSVPNAAPVQRSAPVPNNPYMPAPAVAVPAPNTATKAANAVEIVVLGVDSMGNTAIDISMPGRGISRRVPAQSLLACNVIETSRKIYMGQAQTNVGLLNMGRNLAQQNLPNLAQPDLDEIGMNFAVAAQRAILTTIEKCRQAGIQPG